MNKTIIIHDLLIWIEENLDMSLTLEDISIKAGYSKWHLQRMFKNITGHNLGSYIRGRRLSECAVALRFTGHSILDIGMQYQFDSQQTFTRAFKNNLPKRLQYIVALKNGL